MKVKRILATMLAFIMLIALLPTTTFANLGVTKGEVKIEFVPMKYTDAAIKEFTEDPDDEGYSSIDEVGKSSNRVVPGDTSTPRFRENPIVEVTDRVAIEDIPDDLSGEYMVGIKLSNFTSIGEAANGMATFTLPLVYDNTYVELLDSFTGTLATTFQNRFGSQAVDNIYNSSYSSTNGYYTINGNSIGTATNGTKSMVSIPVVASNLGDPALKGVDEFYIAAIRYKLKRMPAETGAKLFTLSMDDSDLMGAYNEYFTLGFKVGSTDVEYHPTADPASDIRPLFEVDASAINYPTQYTVNFYNDLSAAQTGTSPLSGKSITVPEGQSVDDVIAASSGTITLPGASDFTSPTAGQYYKELYYLDVNGDPQLFDATAQAMDLDSTSMGAGTELKVYATYQAGYTITFSNNSGNVTGAPTTPATKTATVAPDGTSLVAAGDIPATDTDPDWTGQTDYVFDGWNMQSDGLGTAFNPTSDAITSTLNGQTVYAQWSQMKTIYLYPNDGVVTTPIEVKVAPSAAIGSSMPTITHTLNTPNVTYNLKGWSTVSNGATSTGTFYDNTAVTTTNFAAGTELFAQWEPTTGNHSTLTFVPNHPSTTVTVDPASVTVNTNDKVYTVHIPLDPPTTDKWDFDGWYASPSVSDTTEIDFDAGYEVDTNKSVYGHWTYNDTDGVTVKFNNEDGTPYAPDIVVAPNFVLPTNMKPTPDPTKSGGYTFAGWYNSGTKYTFGTDGVGTATPFTLVATFAANVTVEYDVNGGTGGPADVTAGAGDPYANPGTTPTRAGVGANSAYTFVGWNTEQNGSGAYIDATTYTGSYGDLATAYADALTPNKVKLYAQWAAVPAAEVPKVTGTGPAAPQPSQQGVVVTFDSNTPGNLTSATVKDANPKYKYPQYGDSIGDGNMPDVPTRTHYKFASWNTEPNGSGIPVDEDTIMSNDADKLNGAMTPNGDGTYSLTVYAQWDTADDVLAPNKVTLNFVENKNGDGTGGDTKTINLYTGDSLGNDIADPSANAPYEFDDWYLYDSITGTLDLTKPFDHTKPVTGGATYYARWEIGLLLEVKDSVIDYPYTSDDIEPVFDLWQITEDSTSPTGYKKVGATPLKSGTADALKNDITINNGVLKDVASYTVTATIPGTSTYKINPSVVVAPNVLNVTAAHLTVKVDPDTQRPRADGTIEPLGVTVSGILANDTATDVYEVLYKEWNDDGDNIIEESATPSELGTGTITVPASVPNKKYVVEIKLKPDATTGAINYVIDSVDSSNASKALEVYGTSVYANAAANNSNNILFSIMANDPGVTGIAVKSVSGSTETPEVLKASDYTTNKNFAKTDKEYWVRIADTTATDVKFIVTPAESTQVISSPTTGVNVSPNADGTWTVTAPLTNKGATPNEIEIKSAAGSDPLDPTITYKFTVQQLVPVSFKLNYGNSPYGEIMKDSAITDKATAKSKFNTYNYYDPSYTPANAADKADITYGIQAWVKIENLGSLSPTEQAAVENPYVNMDRNDYAIFVYNEKAFKDPGFVATDSLGRPITTVTRKITVDRMQTTQLAGLQDANVTSDPITIPDKAPDYVITEVTMPFDYTDSDTFRIRPGIYEMEYSYTDEVLGPITFADDADNMRVRKVVVLQGRGDSFLEDVINDSSVNPIYTYLKTPSSYNGITEEARWIYYYRVLDADANGAVNDSDPNPIYTYLKTYKPAIDAGNTSVKNPLGSMYVELPSS